MSATTVMSWGEAIAQRLEDARVCPVCAAVPLQDGCCRTCGSDLRGATGHQVWEASTAAAAAMRRREAVLRTVPPVVSAAGAAPAPGAHHGAVSVQPMPTPNIPSSNQAPSTAPPPAGPPEFRERGSSATLQSVLAIAGAGLFAVAAIVFTFLNPDLSDRVLRSVIVAVVTLVFLAGSWALARRGLQFSAEAVGGLGLVFVGLDVYAFAQIAMTATGTWLIAAAATTIAAVTMAFAGRTARIHIWTWGALSALAIVPAMLGYAVGGAWAAACGHIAVAFAAAGLAAVLPRFAPRMVHDAEPSTLEPERRMLATIQVLAVLSALPIAMANVLGAAFGNESLWQLVLVLALVTVHALVATRQLLSAWWSYVAGAGAVASAVMAVHAATVTTISGDWWLATLTLSAVVSFAIGATVPLPRSASRGVLAAGALTVLSVISLTPLGIAALVGFAAVYEFAEGRQESSVTMTTLSWPIPVALATLAAGLWLFAVLARRRPVLVAIVRATNVAATLVAAIAVITLACLPMLPLPVRIGVVLAAAAAAAAGLRWIPRVRDVRTGIRVALHLGVHVAIAASALASWRDIALAPVIGIAVIAALALAAATVATRIRYLHVGAGFAYALVCISQALALTTLGSIAVLCLTTTAGLLCAIVATFIARVGARAWYAVLAVTTVPFVAGIVQVVFERSGWTALSTALMFALALALLVTRRPGLTIVLRTLAAGMLVPTIAVVVVCLGAQVLAVSASPVTLPVIAAIVALVLPSTTLVRDALRRNRLRADAAAAARIAIEASALLTGAIATVLALAREASGLGTTFLVLILLGIGAGASAVFTGRRYGWWVAGAAFTGALWCVWALNGVALVEAYVLPPALAAALVAGLLAARKPDMRGARGLFAAGLGVAVLPTLALLAFARSADAGAAAGAVVAPDALPWRALALLAAGIVLLLFGAGFARSPRMRALVLPTYVAAAVAAVAGPVQGVRMGLGGELSFLHGVGLFFACFGSAAVAAIILTVAARGIRQTAPARMSRSRWLTAPAVLALAIGTWGAIERDWASIWLMWTLMLGLLVLVAVAGARAGRTTLPPVWLLFSVSFVTAVVAWSPRDLRVEWFSLPLGAFLLLAGIAGMRQASASMADASASAALNEWPARWQSSWALLAPGIVTMMSASIVATFTDPLTWRAILVMALALGAIMVGAARRLAAPFILGMLVLPIENVFVFAVQIGRGVQSMPWWITLAVIGAVLLTIAVTYERRTGNESTVVARIRDLR